MKPAPSRLLGPALVLLVLALTGCSGDSGDSGGTSASGGAGSRGGGSASSADAPQSEVAGDLDALTSDTVRAEPASTRQDVSPSGQALIRKGNVSLVADDVGRAQLAVQRVVDAHAGQVTEERTTTDDEGHAAYTRMVLRIPSGDFDEAMGALTDLDDAELDSASTTEDDVTAKLIDTRTRLRVQQRSIARITTLFDRAQSIRDIMAIEAQLSQRQAELESLQRQAAYLTHQTAMSTITVSVDQVPPPRATPKDDDTGFLSGLAAGWSGLRTLAVALATVAGALVPWLVVVVVLGPPALLAYRAVRRRVSASRSGRTPSAA